MTSPARSSHPSLELLTAFGLGKLPPLELASIERHVANCENCCRQLEMVPPDSLVLLLQETQETARSSPLAETHNGRQSDRTTVVPRSPNEIPHDLADHPRYRIVEQIGQGGMGTVYKAEHRLMERTVALKVINQRLVNNQNAAERFQREVKAAARLSHPSIVAAHDADRAGSIHFLVMEHVEGVNLAQVVERQGPLPVTQACDYIRQAAAGLQHAFEAGMVHRDIKPQNLMLTGQGQIKILDFGLARFASEAEPAKGLTDESVLLGTPDYLAPEQATDARTADIRADIYSLGCTLFFLLAGKPPFCGGTAMQKILAHREKEPSPLAEVRSDMPPGLVEVLQRMLAKEPARRHQTPEQVAQALCPFLQESEPGSGSSPGPHPIRWWSRFLAAFAAILAIGAVSLGPVIIRIATDKGQLVIQTDDPNIEVVVKQGGRQVTILDGKTKKQIDLTAGEYEIELAGAADGLRLSTDRFTLKRGDRQVVELWREPLAAESLVFAGHTGKVRTVTWAPNGLQAASGAGDKTARIWDVKTGKQLCRLDHPDSVTLVAFASKADQLFTVSDRVYLWDAKTGQELKNFGLPSPRSSLALSPDGRLALLGRNDGALRLWDVEKEQDICRFVGHQARINAITFSADGKLAVSGSGGPDQDDFSIRLWDVTTGKELKRFAGHYGDVHQVAITADCRRMLSVSDDTTVRLWSLEKGGELCRFRGHQDQVFCSALSRDGLRAVSGGRGNAIHLWDVATTKEIRTLVGHTAPVRTLAFSPDGRFIFSGSEDTTVRLWRMPQ